MEKLIQELQAELKGFIAKQQEEEKTRGAATTETKNAIQELVKRLDALEVRLAKPAGGGGTEQKTLETALKENDRVQAIMRGERTKATLQFKSIEDLQVKTVTSTTISTAGADLVTPGVVDAQRLAGIVPPARRGLIARGLFSRAQTTSPLVYFVKYESDFTKASPQIETSPKHENAASWDTAQASVRTIATTIKASRQIIEDFGQLMNEIQSGLRYAVLDEEERQILFGDNTGQNLNGVHTQATAFDTSLLSAGAGWEYEDVIGASIEQVAIANEVEPNFVALHPSAWWKIRKAKDTTGRYLYGDPMNPASNFQIWGLSVVPSTVFASTAFLVGSNDPACAQIFDRVGLTVDIATENDDDFVKNLITIRAEERLVMVVKRPAAFIKGTFNTSPA